MSLLPFSINRNHGQSALAVGLNMGTVSTLALSTSYAFGTRGAAGSMQFAIDQNAALTDFYFSASAKAGTGSTDSNLNWYIHSGFDATLNHKPGATVVASGTIPISSIVTGNWTSVTGLNVSLSAGTWYNFIIADVDGGATNNITINHRVTTGDFRSVGVLPNCNSTTNGWSTAGTVAGAPGVLALKIGGEMYGGAFGNAASNFTSNTTARGVKLTIPAGYPRVRYVGIQDPQMAAIGGKTLKVFKGGGTLPNTTPYWSWSVPSSLDYAGTQFNSGSSAAVFFPDPPLITPGETWYFVIVPDSATTNPGKYTTFGGADANILSLMSGLRGVSYKAVQETAGPAWTEYDHLVYWQLLFIPEVSPTIAG